MGGLVGVPSWSGVLSTYQRLDDKHSNPLALSCLDELYALLEPEEVDCTPTTCTGKKCPHKDGLAWSPGHIPAGKTRLAGNVVGLSVAGFDLDHLTQLQLEAVAVKIEGVECFLHSSHNHHPPDDQALRLVFPLSREVKPKEWPALWRAIVANFEIPVDVKAKDPCRVFFLPRRPRGAPFVSVRGEGALLDVNELLLAHHAASKARQDERVHVDRPPAEEGERDLVKLRACLRRYDPEDDHSGEKREMIRRVLACEPLADKPGGSAVKFDGPPIHGRDDAVFRTATIVGWLMPLGTPTSVAMELLQPSIAKIPNYEDDGSNENFDGWMQKAAWNYEKSHEKKTDEMAMRNKLIAMVHAKSGHVVSAPSVEITTSGENTDEEAPEDEEGVCTDDDRMGPWRLEMKTKTTENGDIRPDQVGYNVSLVLEQHAAWKGRLRFNDLTKDIDCDGGPISKADKKADLLTAVENWLQREENLNLHVSVVCSRLLYVARRHSHDPVKEYLESIRWDGVPRLDTMLEKYCGALTTNEQIDVTGFVRTAGAKWMISGAARGLNPGCKADNVLVLEGPQGIGKTTMLEVLGGQWYAKSENTLTDKDSKMLVGRAWIVELAELSAVRNTETEAQKAFFTAREDMFRPPYGRKVESFPRHCIFAGTTNEGTYLRDETGNRRYWCISCGRFNLIALRRDRDQLWAEAVSRYKSGELWYFDEAQSASAEQVANQRLRGSNIVDSISDWWLRMDPDRRPTEFTITDIAVGALDIPRFKIEESSAWIGRALKKMGFTKKHARREFGDRVWVYEARPEHLALPKRLLDRRGHLSLVAGAKATNGPTEVQG